MATIAGLLHHLIDHAPGLSETNRQEYHEAVGEAMPAPEEQAPEEQAPEEQAPEEQAPEGQ